MRRTLFIGAFILASKFHVSFAACPSGCVDLGKQKLPDGRVVTVCDCRKLPPPKTVATIPRP